MASRNSQASSNQPGRKESSLVPHYFHTRLFAHSLCCVIVTHVVVTYLANVSLLRFSAGSGDGWAGEKIIEEGSLLACVSQELHLGVWRCTYLWRYDYDIYSTAFNKQFYLHFACGGGLGFGDCVWSRYQKKPGP